ncbi:MAG: hypothetical protein CFE25_17135 [Chitinophagaceae bacterium BSSC1]|nr:MAG: hypothetical protein CFE25_17135 [Chitinophagaceae bacterium BSSC1]
MPRNPQVNFYLQPAGTDKKALIFLNFKYNKQRLFYSFGERIDPKDWDLKRQRGLEKLKLLTQEGEHALNDLLDNLKNELEDKFKAEKATGIPTPKTLKKHLDAYMNKHILKEVEQQENNFFSLLDRFIDGKILKNGADLKTSTLKSYKTARMHLKEFQAKTKYLVDFETINEDFFDKFLLFLKKTREHKFTKEKGIKINAIAKTVSIIQVVMKKAIVLKYTKNDEFKNFRVKTVEVENVYLPFEEIIKLYRFDFSDYKKLERVRDLFVFGCFLGQRFSDFSDIKPENIVKGKDDLFIKMITKKTKTPVTIPCNPIILEIFEKYKDNHNKLPKSISNQKFNEYIKIACRKAGMTEKGRLTSKPEIELCDCISSHTVRRSFATNYYLEGFPTIELMRITGHATESSFLKYIKVGQQESAQRLAQHIKNNWSEKMLRVA